MGKYCFVCKQAFVAECKYSFHLFPKNIQRYNNWVVSLKLGEEIIPKFCYVCSKHFKESDFDETRLGGKRILKKNAVPSLFEVEYKFFDECTIRREETRTDTIITPSQYDVEFNKFLQNSLTQRDGSSTDTAPSPPQILPARSSPHFVFASLFKEEPIDSSYQDDPIDSSFRDELTKSSVRDELANSSVRDELINSSFKEEPIDSSFKEEPIDSPFKEEPIPSSYQDDPIDSSFRDEQFNSSFQNEYINFPSHGETIDSPFQDEMTDSPFQVETTDSPFQDESMDSMVCKIEPTEVNAHEEFINNILRPSSTYIYKSSTLATGSQITMKTCGNYEKKRQRYWNPKFVGDCVIEDMDSPETARRNWKIAEAVITSQRKKIKTVQRANLRFKRKITSLKEHINELQQKLKVAEAAAINISDSLPQSSEHLIRRILEGSKHNEYSPELRTFALRLNFYSNKAYNFVRETFNNALPHSSTLTKWYQSADAPPDFMQPEQSDESIEGEIGPAVVLQ